MVCKNCALYAKFKENCHFFWEGKRSCTQFVDKETGVQCFKNIDEEFEKLISENY